MNDEQRRPLKIGYLWQYEQADMSKGTASILHIEAVIESLKDLGHQVRFITYKDGYPCWSDDRIHWHRADLGRSISRPFRLLEKTIRSIQSLLRLPYLRLFDSYRFSEACMLALAEYDILYERFWLLGYGGLITAKRLGIPLISELNGDLFENYNQLGIKLSKAQWIANRWITRYMYKHTDHIITVSESLRERTLERWSLSLEKVTTVPNGVHIDTFTTPPASEVADRLRSKLNGQLMVMFVGTFKPWHGIDLLLEAFQQVISSNINASLVLVGDGPLRAEIENQVAALDLADRVIFTGKVTHDEVASLLNVAHVATISPRTSPATAMFSPLKLFEYMAAGKAIVASANPNIKGILVDNRNALLVPPDDSEALAKALSSLLKENELRLTLGQAARQDAIAKHSWHRVATEIETIMLEVLN